MITAQDARQIASSYEAPKETLHTVMEVVLNRIHEAASKGLFEVKLDLIPLTGEVKKELKARGFKVSTYSYFDDYYKKKIPSGKLDISWKE